MRRFYKHFSYESGQVMMITVVLFLVISLIVVLGVAAPVLKEVKASVDSVNSQQSYYLAEGTLEDAVYRLQSNKTVSSGDSITLNGYTATVSVTSGLDGKTVDVTSNRGGIVRKMEANVTTGVGAAFNYGIETGNGGFNLSGGSKINGNVYSNGSIIATNGVTITGSAIAADSAALTSDQSNIGPTPITTCTTSTCISFGNTSSSQDVAQSFKVSTAGPIHDVQFYIKKIGTPSDITIRLVADNSGSPGTTNLFSTTQTLPAAQVTSSFGWVDVVFTDNPGLDPSQTYWLVLDNSSTNSSKYYQIGATNGGYANGTAKVGSFGGTWNATSPSGLDTYFNLYLGGLTSSIGGGSSVGSVVIGSGGVGDAWAHTVTGASVAGGLYCQSGAFNNKSCNTSRPDPSPTGMPLSAANIQDFKDQATTTGSGWTYSGNLTIGSQGTTTTTLHHITGNLIVNGGGTADMTDLQVDGNVTITGGGTFDVGPMTINGNLDVESNMTMKGTVYAKGMVTIGGGGTVRLDASYGTNSGVLISDGYMVLTGGGNFYGSGQTGSYPLLLTTSTCPNGSGCGTNDAISFSGGAGAVVLNAQYGTLSMSGGTNAKELTAYEVDVSGGGTVTYDSGLANLNFSSGPSGGWDIASWQEVQ